MPSTSEKQRKFMGAELARKRSGQKTSTGMSEQQLSDYASKPVKSKEPEVNPATERKKTKPKSKGDAKHVTKMFPRKGY